MTLYGSILLSADQMQKLAQHARDGMPCESCAVLLGDAPDGNARVAEVSLTSNACRSPTRFEIPGEELIRIYRRADAKNLDVVGIFHSHPHSAAYPSASDAEFMKINPVVWVILGSTFEFHAFVLNSGMHEIPILSKP